MKFLSTFKITKGFDTWLKMYKEIEPDLNDLGIKILWAGTNSDETKVFDITEVKDPSKFEVLVKREDITKKRADCSSMLYWLQFGRLLDKILLNTYTYNKLI